MADEIISELGHMGSLAASVTIMLAEASGLPDPKCMTVYGILEGRVHDSVSLQFEPVEASTEAIALWAIRFGGVVESQTRDFEDGPELYVRTEFPCYGLKVTAFALIPLPELEAITSKPETASPF